MAAVCVANWLPRKGPIELLEAVAGLPDDVVTLHLVGDTATRSGSHVVCASGSRTPTCVTGSWCAASSTPQRCAGCTRPSMPSCCRASRSRRNGLGRGDGGGAPRGWLAGRQSAIPGRSWPRRPARARGRCSGAPWRDRRAGPRPGAPRAVGTRSPPPRSVASDVGRDGRTLLRDHPGGVGRAPNTSSATRSGP